MTPAPSLPAWRHWHGAPAGHREAHCRDVTSPYASAGYDLAEVGPAPRLLISDADHPRPLGPVALRLVEGAR